MTNLGEGQEYCSQFLGWWWRQGITIVVVVVVNAVVAGHTQMAHGGYEDRGRMSTQPICGLAMVTTLGTLGRIVAVSITGVVEHPQSLDQVLGYR